LKEEQFDNHVEIAMWWVSEQLELELSQEGNSIMAESDTLVFRQKIDTKVDSLMTWALTWFNLKKLNYTLQVLPNTDQYVAFSYSGTTYRCSAAKQLKDNGLEFRLIFEDKDGWIISQLKFLLISSFALVIFVTACFLLSLRTLWKQKVIFETTSNFISNMTHEFKTPITNVGFASSLLNRVQAVSGSQRASKLNKIIKEENNKLQHHVEQILNLARLEKGEMTLNKINFSIHDAIDESIKTMDLQIKNKKGKIKTNFLAERFAIDGDKIHIINTITNLIDNANKYSVNEPEIFISTFNKGVGIVVSVADKGIGMSSEKQKLVFKKFYRAPTGNLHNVKGFGLGLSYAKMVVDAHSGNIAIKSEQGKGSCFEVFLPLSV
jgi:two-component system phosphate regulon sensor histidine kinase PhoR